MRVSSLQLPMDVLTHPRAPRGSEAWVSHLLQASRGQDQGLGTHWRLGLNG